jgi:D-amino-acid dehydrogenase
MEDTDVLVIGGGAVGVSSAYYLHKAGLHVTLVDQGEICSGSSHGNAGLIVPSHSIPLAAPGVIEKGLKWMFNPESPFYIKPRFDLAFIKWLWQFWKASESNKMRQSIPLIRDLSLQSLSLFKEINEDGFIDFDFHQQGLLLLYKHHIGMTEGQEEADLLNEYGLITSSYSSEALTDLLPSLTHSSFGGIHFIQDAHISPGKYVRLLSEYLSKQGVRVCPHTEVMGFDQSKGQINGIHTTRGYFKAKEIVLSAGAWSPILSQMLSINLPIQPAKGYSITIKRPHDWPELPMVLSEAKVGVTPMGETLRFGGTLELAGFDLSINQRRVDAILNAIPQYFPGLRIKEDDILEIWRGLRPCSPDGLPFLGRSSKYKNLIVAAGHAMIGVSLGPITGKLVTDLICNHPIDIDISPLATDRFST